MNGKAGFSFRVVTLLGLSLIAAGSAALLGGCKGNTTAAAVMEHRTGQPPVVKARRAAPAMQNADPLSNPVWQAAMLPLTAPTNTTRTTSPTRGAVFFDDAALYAAFICEKPAHAPAESKDVVSFYIDPLAQDTELFQITVDATGEAHCAWLRCSRPAEPMEDGSPNLGHPVSVNVDVDVKGLVTKVREGTEEGHDVWAVQIMLPINGLPKTLRVPPAAGAHWKFNLVRTFTTLNGGHVVDQAQANLSPFYVNALAVSPYRMAELDFDEKLELTRQ